MNRGRNLGAALPWYILSIIALCLFLAGGALRSTGIGIFDLGGGSSWYDDSGSSDSGWYSDSGSSDGSGWDWGGSDSGGWDSGGGDSGGWDSGGGDSGGWDSGGGDSGSW